MIETKSLAEEPSSRAPSTAATLYVSTGLAFWATDQPRAFARDVQINDTAYRRLDPEYYAWLRSRMNLAKMAANAGKVGRNEFDELRHRFNTIHEWAMGHFGEPRLAEAVRSLDAREYRPPASESDGRSTGTGRENFNVSAGLSDAIALVDAVAENAIALGWKRERLYETGKGLFDPRRGLVCFLKPGDRIGEVTAHSIEIILPGLPEVRHRFYNPDVEQPWIKKIGTAPQNAENLPGRPGISR
jgi:hypothetical protein